MEHLNDTLGAEEGAGIRVVGKAERYPTTRVGRLTFQRRNVPDCTTGWRYPPGRGFGVSAKGTAIPRGASTGGAGGPSDVPHGAARLLRAWIPSLSAMACGHRVQRVGARLPAQQASDRAMVAKHEEAPTGARRVGTLHLETDRV